MMDAGNTLVAVLQKQRDELVASRNRAIGERDDRQREMFDAGLNLKAARKEFAAALSLFVDTQREHKALSAYCDDGTAGVPQYLLTRIAALADAEKTARDATEAFKQRVLHREQQLADAQRAYRQADDAFNEVSRNITDLDRRIQALNEVRADHSVNGR